MKKFLTPILAITLFFTALSSSSLVAGEYKIGVLAKNGASKAMAKWGQLGNYLSTKIADDSFTIVPLDFDAVMPAVEKGDVDYFLVNSSMFVTTKVNGKHTWLIYCIRAATENTNPAKIRINIKGL